MSKSSPIIGITSYGRNAEHRFTIPAEYVDAVRTGGGIPIILPPGEPQFRSLLDLLDGIIIAGGGDIDPMRYGGKPHETIYMLDTERDQSEIEIMLDLLKREIPMFCICRGMQVLNVALGGTLITHLPDVVGDTVQHRLPPREPNPHMIYANNGTLLTDIIGQSEFNAVSWHHQAVEQLAPPLSVVATASDGIIEAVEMTDHPWLLAVQWHPELSAAQDPLQQKLFNALVEATQKEKNSET